MKAIPTKYKGITFRSRTEAKWAYFFDLLGIAWQYEPEGYDLNGLWYLPDFLLWSLDECFDNRIFVEVKPFIGPDEIGQEKIRRLAVESGSMVIVLSGTPDRYKAKCIWIDIIDEEATGEWSIEWFKNDDKERTHDPSLFCCGYATGLECGSEVRELYGCQDVIKDLLGKAATFNP